MHEKSVAALISRLGEGDAASLDCLVEVTYRELHRLAQQIVSHEPAAGRTRPTALVNHLYLELRRQGVVVAESEGHFFGIAAYLMRQIVVAQARRRRRAKHGGEARAVPWTWSLQLEARQDLDADDIVALDRALDRLAEQDSLKARIVELRFFAGLSLEAAAAALALSPATVKRHWAVARVWLFDQIRSGVSA